MFSNTQVFTFDIDFNYILALWTSTNWSMLFLGLIFQHSNTPSYIYLDIGLLKHPQHHFTFIPVALNSELHYYNHLNAPPVQPSMGRNSPAGLLSVHGSWVWGKLLAVLRLLLHCVPLRLAHLVHPPLCPRVG